MWRVILKINQYDSENVTCYVDETSADMAIERSVNLVTEEMRENGSLTELRNGYPNLVAIAPVTTVRMLQAVPTGSTIPCTASVREEPADNAWREGMDEAGDAPVDSEGDLDETTGMTRDERGHM